MTEHGPGVDDRILTVDEFQRLPDGEGRMELVRGGCSGSRRPVPSTGTWG